MIYSLYLLREAKNYQLPLPFFNNKKRTTNNNNSICKKFNRENYN